MLNKNDESEHPCLVSDLRRNAPAFHYWIYDVSCGIVIYGPCKLKYVPSMSTSWRVFIVNKHWILSKALSKFQNLSVKWLYKTLH